MGRERCATPRHSDTVSDEITGHAPVGAGSAIAKVRRQQPAAYMKICALLPRETIVLMMPPLRTPVQFGSTLTRTPIIGIVACRVRANQRPRRRAAEQRNERAAWRELIALLGSAIGVVAASATFQP
jgi:hypothetical protein